MKIELLRLKTKTTLDEQTQKVIEEAIEFKEAHEHGIESDRNEELFDLLQAILGLIDKLDEGTIFNCEIGLGKKLIDRKWETNGYWLINRSGHGRIKGTRGT